MSTCYERKHFNSFADAMKQAKKHQGEKYPLPLPVEAYNAHCHTVWCVALKPAYDEQKNVLFLKSEWL